MTGAGASLEERLLILAPLGKDGPLTAAKLAAAGLQSLVCRDLASLVEELDRGAAALLVAEEALATGTQRLACILARQPAWSDLPILVLTRLGADSGIVAAAVRTLGNVILLERPVRVATLISAARTALRARLRQYESRAQLQSLEEADRRKDEFLATLAHELRNPLAPLRNSVELLQMAEDSLPTPRKLADMMGRQVSHMVRLVDDLLEISRITRGTIELRRSPVQLAAVVASAVETSQPAIEAADHRLEVVLPHEPIWLDADPTRLAQVFSNLLNNAAKYTDRGGHIRLGAEEQDGEVG
ncbi:MAG TPA: HAMP domain-containing sensor histidine kinase, partial [Lautropia sp.]|nr:HAMP domain-containing sensor histidine kinase [Lautropia sp.]